MKNYNDECLYKDTYTIILMMNKKMRSKISKNFIDFLKDNQDITFEGTINSKIPLKEQELRYEVRLMLSLIYINYICDDETKREIQLQEAENIKAFYNNDIFAPKTTEEIEEKTPKKVVEMIIYKQSFITKIINKIKSIFKQK